MKLNLAVAVALCLGAATARAQLRVACAGEHSTQSAFVADPDEYPALLQPLLGAGYQVGNFGYRRATVQLDGPSLYPASTPYLQTAEYQNSVVFQPDVVILGPFGRHDCNLEYADAGSIDRAKFTTGLKNIVAAYRALPKPPRILIALPIPYANGDGVGVMHEVVLPATHEVATELGLAEIDHWNTFLGQPVLFANPDHFTDAGIELMAATVRDALFRELDAGADAGIDAGTPDAGTLQMIDPKLGTTAKGCSTTALAPALGLLALLAVRRRRG
jgi:alpha-L-fucosidase 2